MILYPGCGECHHVHSDTLLTTVCHPTVIHELDLGLLVTKNVGLGFSYWGLSRENKRTGDPTHRQTVGSYPEVSYKWFSSNYFALGDP